MEKTKSRAIITDKLVIEKTGKSTEAWFKILDKKGAKEMKHIDIFNLISNTTGLNTLGEWNHNLLATTYEWDRGIKERGQKENGFEVSVSKTIEVSISNLFQSWADEKQRNKWLGKEKIIIRKATQNKSARITWSDNETSLSVDFYPKAENKSQVVVQHLKIPDSQKATTLKVYWAKMLGALKIFLEKKFFNKMIFETERLVLREFSFDDAEFIIALLNSEGWLRFIGDRNVKTIDDAKNYLLNGPMKSYKENGFGLSMVETKNDHTPIGMCGLIKRLTLEDIDIGFAFLPEFAGKGYAYEIASALMAHAKDSLGINKIVAITVEDNEHSIRLLNKIGLRFEKKIQFPEDKEVLMLFSPVLAESK